MRWLGASPNDSWAVMIWINFYRLLRPVGAISIQVGAAFGYGDPSVSGAGLD